MYCETGSGRVDAKTTYREPTNRGICDGIVERCHRTVKPIADRKGCTIMEAVYWYIFTPWYDA